MIPVLPYMVGLKHCVVVGNMWSISVLSALIFSLIVLSETVRIFFFTSFSTISNPDFASHHQDLFPDKLSHFSSSVDPLCSSLGFSPSFLWSPQYNCLLSLLPCCCWLLSSLPSSSGYSPLWSFLYFLLSFLQWKLLIFVSNSVRGGRSIISVASGSHNFMADLYIEFFLSISQHFAPYLLHKFSKTPYFFKKFENME